MMLSSEFAALNPPRAEEEDDDDWEDPFAPVKRLYGNEVSLADACRLVEADPIIKRFGTWAVTEYGVECLATYYAIEKDRLEEQDWERHVNGKAWVEWWDFARAIRFARRYFSKPKKAPAHVPPAVVSRPVKPRSSRHKIPNRVRFLVLQRDRYRCQICGRSAQDGALLHIDHKVARANGGSDQLDNLWVLCSLCNNGKGTHPL